MIIMKLKCLFRDVIDIMSEGYRVTKERDYLVRLNYAMSKLSVPLDDKQLNHDRFLTLEAVMWLFEYYNKDIIAINNVVVVCFYIIVSLKQWFQGICLDGPAIGLRQSEKSSL